jgi:hypothetical protein
MFGWRFCLPESMSARENIMRSAFGFAGILIVLLIGYLIYASQIREMGDGKPLKQQIDMVGVKGDLLSLAQAEKLYNATNGSYASLEELRRSNVMSTIPEGGRSGYQYTIEVSGSEHFQITADPPDTSETVLPTLSIDETMQLSQK